MTQYILTATSGLNCDVLANILALYAEDGDAIADVTYGRGNFWTGIDTRRYKLYATDLSTGTDARHLPYRDVSMDMVVVDPPYMHSAGSIMGKIDAVYGNNDTTPGMRLDGILRLYADMMREALRVLKRRGYCVVKCQDQIQSGIQHWMHLSIYEEALKLGYYGKDLFVLLQQGVPARRWKHQLHARKNHSYFWVFQKR